MLGSWAKPDGDAEPVLEEAVLGGREATGVSEGELDTEGADRRTCSAKASRASTLASIPRGRELQRRARGKQEKGARGAL